MKREFYVRYCVGYLGFGVNEYAQECFKDNEEAAMKRMEELRAENYSEVKMFSITVKE